MTRYHVKMWKLICVRLQDSNSLHQITCFSHPPLKHGCTHKQTPLLPVSSVTSWWLTPANVFCAPTPALNTSTCLCSLHSHTYTHRVTQPLKRTAIAVVDWPSGLLGLFLVGRSIIGQWTAVFNFIFIFLFIHLFIYLFLFCALPWWLPYITK